MIPKGILVVRLLIDDVMLLCPCYGSGIIRIGGDLNGFKRRMAGMVQHEGIKRV